VVAILGMKDSKLPQDEFPPGTPVLANASVTDFFPFNDILAYNDLFITNGGYGGFQHAVGSSILFIVTSETQDKTRSSDVNGVAGLRSKIRSGKPAVESLRAAVDEVLGNGKYALKTKWDPIGVIAENIDELISENRRTS